LGGGLPAVTLPCDISEPPFVLNPDSTLSVPDGAGIGVQVIGSRVAESVNHWVEVTGGDSEG